MEHDAGGNTAGSYLNACSGGGMDCSVSSGGGGTLRWYELWRATRPKQSHTHGRSVEGPTRVQETRHPVHATIVATTLRGGCASERMHDRSQ